MKFKTKGLIFQIRHRCLKGVIFGVIFSLIFYVIFSYIVFGTERYYFKFFLYQRSYSLAKPVNMSYIDFSNESVDQKKELGGSEILKQTAGKITAKITIPNPASGRKNVQKFPRYAVFNNVSLVSKSFRDNHFMTVKGNGRLGNKMFQLASMIGVAAMHGYTPCSNDMTLWSVFDLNIIKNRKVLGCPTYSERHGAGIYDNIVEKIDLNKNAILDGYFQSWKYFAHVEDEVRRNFKFKNATKEKVNSLLKSLDTEYETLVGIHIRRGDMNTKRELSRGYNVAPKEYLLKAVKYFKSKYKNVVFLIVSDDTNWSKKHLVGEEFRFVSSRVAHQDLAILAHAHHTIITSGTFGWWGGFLAGGDVVYYENYPKKGSWLDSVYKREDYYPPHWIPMQ